MEGKAKNNLIEGSIKSTLVKFAIPFLLANLLQALYGAVDLIIVGKFADSIGVAAVSTGSQVMQTITGVISGLTAGGTVLIGQYIGAKKKKDVSEAIGTIVTLFIIISIVLSGGMLLCTGQIVHMMKTPMEAIQFTKEYIIICSIGIIFIVGYNSVSGILRGMGDSKTPLLFVAVSSIINVILDIVFVSSFNMGAKGAAIATIISQAVSLILAIMMLKKRDLGIKLIKEDLKIKKDKVANVFKLGMPIAMQDLLISISFLIITAIINVMGVTASASVGVVGKIISFMMIPPIAFSAAISTMTAQNIGAGEYERAKKAMWAGVSFSLVFGVFCFIYSQFQGEVLVRIFTNDAKVIESSVLYLKAFSIDCILVCFIFCMNGFFSGCGHSMFSMGHSVLTTFLVRIPVAYILSKTAGATLYGIGLAAPAASAISIIICLVYLKSGKWRISKILNVETA